MADLTLQLDPRTITELELVVRVYGSADLRRKLRDAVVRAQAQRLNAMAAQVQREREAARPQGDFVEPLAGPFVGRLSTGGTGV